MRIEIIYSLQSYTLFFKITPVKRKKVILITFLVLFSAFVFRG